MRTSASDGRTTSRRGRPSGEFLLLLNPDTVLLDDAVEGILTFARNRPEARIWGGRTLFADGSLNPTSCWRDPTLWSLLCQITGLNKIFPGSELFNPEPYGNWDRSSEREVEMVTGCFFLIRREFWNELGGFDPDYFIYAEEADLCHRARLRGARPAVTPDVAIVHHGGGSQKQRGPRIVRLFRGKATFIRKHWSAPKRRVNLGSDLWLEGYRFGAALTGNNRWRETAEEWVDAGPTVPSGEQHLPLPQDHGPPGACQRLNVTLSRYNAR